MEDSNIPMWSIKTRGKTFYVNHVDCEIPWSTKETPANSHTKGSIKIRNCMLRIDSDNCAIISKPTELDRRRSKNPEAKSIRVLMNYGSATIFKQLSEQMSIEYGKFKQLTGRCGTVWYITELWSEQDFTALVLSLPTHSIRQLSENEPQYSLYDRSDDYEQYDQEEE